MVSANLSYRNHVPYGYFAFEVSNLNFYGDLDVTQVLKRLTNLIEFDKSNEHKIKIEKLREHKQSNYSEWLEWQKEIKTLKREHLLWMLSKELREKMSTLKSICNKLGANDEHLSLAITQLENNRFYEASELTLKFKKILAEIGFTCKAATRNDSNLYEEIYESTCSDEELKTRAESKIAELEKAQQEKRSTLTKRYSQTDIIDSREIFYM